MTTLNEKHGLTVDTLMKQANLPKMNQGKLNCKVGYF